jgi:hypothetical protein
MNRTQGHIRSIVLAAGLAGLLLGAPPATAGDKKDKGKGKEA